MCRTTKALFAGNFRAPGWKSAARESGLLANGADREGLELPLRNLLGSELLPLHLGQSGLKQKCENCS